MALFEMNRRRTSNFRVGDENDDNVETGLIDVRVEPNRTRPMTSTSTDYFNGQLLC